MISDRMSEKFIDEVISRHLSGRAGENPENPSVRTAGFHN